MLFLRVIAWYGAEKISLKKSCFYLYIRRRYVSNWSETVVGGIFAVLYYAYTFEPRYFQQHILLVSGIHADEEDAVAMLIRQCVMYRVMNTIPERNRQLIWEQCRECVRKLRYLHILPVN